MRTPYTDIIDTKPKEKLSRGSKPFTIIAKPEKKEPVQFFHCPIHRGMRLLLPGYICPIHGPTVPAIKIVDTE